MPWSNVFYIILGAIKLCVRGDCPQSVVSGELK